MGNNEWRTALISGHVCKSGKQMNNEKTGILTSTEKSKLVPVR